METERGITEYLYKGSGCGGILKMRYSDFIVHEVDLNGNLVHFDPNMVEMKEEEKEDTPKVDYDESIEDKMKAILSNVPEKHDPFTEEQLDQMAKIEADGKCKTKLDVEADDMDKVTRTNIHNFIREYFPNLESAFRQDQDKSFITISRSKRGSKKRRSQSDVRLIYKFVLYKENIGTMDAVHLIGKKLNLKNYKGFNFGGTKDKRGITTQDLTTTINPQRMMQINKKLNNLRVGNFRVVKEHMKLGDLKGNYFSIVLRDIHTKDCSIDEACKSLSTNGFINYFGMQRFGTGKVPTQDVGKAILSCDWVNVVELILSNSYDGMRGDMGDKLRNWQVEGNAKACISHLDRKANVERSLLNGLIKFGPKQIVQALNFIPRSTRLLYLHSYQSYVWNRMVSKRIKEFGLKVVIGDLVQIESSESSDTPYSDEPDCKKAKLDSEGKVDEHDNANGEYERPADPIIKRITCEDDITKYEISQIVLPLPGCDVIYPRYNADTSECWYKNMIEKDDGVQMSSFNHHVKTYHVGGAYRRILSYPQKLKYQVMKYNNYMLPLMSTDKDKSEEKEEPKTIENGEYSALKISFQLPTSSYATIALREITKSDLGSANQMNIERQHKQSQQ